MNATLTKIKQRGFWEVVIRPSRFVENLIEPLGDCKKLIGEQAVQFRGWPYPPYDRQTPPTAGHDYVEQSVDCGVHIEVWRYYQSGQFVHFFAMREDWLELDKYDRRLQIAPGSILWITNAIYSFTEVFEFASRLASKGLLGDSCKVSTALHGTQNRVLEFPQSGRLLLGTYRSGVNSITTEITATTTELMARSADLALERAAWVFQRFNWDHIVPQALKEDQRQLLERRLL